MPPTWTRRWRWRSGFPRAAGRRGRGAPALRDSRETANSIEQVLPARVGPCPGVLVGFLGDMDLAEEAAEGRVPIAAPSSGPATGRRSTRWPGWWPPDATARSTACDVSGRSRTRRRLVEADQPAETMDEIDLNDSTIPDERLELIFTCCHPALAVRSEGWRYVRALGGLTTEEIARAFLVSDETISAGSREPRPRSRRRRSRSRFPR